MNETIVLFNNNHACVQPNAYQQVFLDLFSRRDNFSLLFPRQMGCSTVIINVVERLLVQEFGQIVITLASKNSEKILQEHFKGRHRVFLMPEGMEHTLQHSFRFKISNCSDSTLVEFSKVSNNGKRMVAPHYTNPDTAVLVNKFYYRLNQKMLREGGEYHLYPTPETSKNSSSIKMTLSRPEKTQPGVLGTSSHRVLNFTIFLGEILGGNSLPDRLSVLEGVIDQWLMEG